MFVAELQLHNFRNHEETRLEFGKGINALLGNNGEGKTNVLEAISYLSLTKSFYSAGDAPVVQLGKQSFVVEGRLCSDAGVSHTVRIVYGSPPGEKTFTIDRSKPETFGSVIGRFPIVILSPEKSEVTFGAPAERRKFLDLLLSQASPSYFSDLMEFRKILRHRNRILLDSKLTGQRSDDTLDVWTEGLVNHGSRVSYRRQRFVEEFAPYVIRAYGAMAGEKEIPSLKLATLCGEGVTAEDIAQNMRLDLKAKRGEELRRGTTLVGPHRDELLFSMNGVHLQNYASQGQHKTLLVALKVAEFFYLKERRNEVPLFLLDDVFTELDEHRSRQLVRVIEGLGQTFVTTTTESHFYGAIEWDGLHRWYRVAGGHCARTQSHEQKATATGPGTAPAGA